VVTEGILNTKISETKAEIKYLNYHLLFNEIFKASDVLFVMIPTVLVFIFNGLQELEAEPLVPTRRRCAQIDSPVGSQNTEIIPFKQR
jgi:hypothetical protein